MFKRIRENEKYQKIKELWQNPKTHSIIVLIFWFIFIALVILFLRLSAPTPNTSSKPLPTSDNFENIYSYEFSYYDNHTIVHGQAYNDKQEFILGNNRYYYDENIYQINGDNVIKQNLDLGNLKITPKMLNNLLGKLTGTEQAEYTRYLVPLDRFINLYEIDTDADLTKAMTYNIIVDVYKKNKAISKIVLDLTNYHIFRFNNNIKENITIYFYNINKVTDFTNEFTKIVGGIK